MWKDWWAIPLFVLAFILIWGVLPAAFLAYFQTRKEQEEIEGRPGHSGSMFNCRLCDEQEGR